MPDQTDNEVSFEPLRRYTRVRFPELTDEQLANHSFTIDDPLSLPNLRDDEPPLDQDLTWIGEYQLKHDVKCVFGHVHRWGFVFRDEEGRHYLIGNECGAKLLGSNNWRDFDRRQKELTNRSMYLRQLFAIRAAFANHRDWIKRLAKTFALKEVVELCREVETYPELLKAVRRSITRDNGELFVITKVRMIEEEIKREEREATAIEFFEKLTLQEQTEMRKRGIAPKITKTQILREQKVRAGTLQGLALFASRTSAMPDTVKELVKQVDGFLGIEKMPATRKDVERVSINVRELVKKILKVRDDANEVISFFAQENLELFARWADQNRFDDCRFRAEPGRLVIEPQDDSNFYTLSRPVRLVLIDDERFDVLAAASSAFSRHFETTKRSKQSPKAGQVTSSSSAIQSLAQSIRR